MTRYGAQYGPDITFLGVDRCDLGDPRSLAGADVVVLGAPFDGGTSHRPGTRFGPLAIRMTDYLPHDGSRPSLALRTDGLPDLRVLDAGAGGPGPSGLPRPRPGTGHRPGCRERAAGSAPGTPVATTGPRGEGGPP